MQKTLGSLAAAMTVTAVVLHWLDPSVGAVGKSLTPEELADMAQSAVSDSILIDPRLWREIEVVIDDQPAPEGWVLAARRGQDRCHFHVDAYGRPSRRDWWIRQDPLAGAPSTIRIHVDRANSTDHLVEPGQWLAVRLIVDALAAVLADGGPIPVRISG